MWRGPWTSTSFTADLVVDAEGVVSSYPGVASRIPDAAPASP
jgi:hypothetical protein